jgi:hypothetical protein
MEPNGNLGEHTNVCVDTKFLRDNMIKYPYRVDSSGAKGSYIFRFDSIDITTSRAPFLKVNISMQEYYNCSKRIIDKSVDKAWIDGMQQYRSDSLLSYDRNFPHAYDSINVNRIIHYLWKKKDTVSINDIQRAGRNRLIGTEFPERKLQSLNGTSTTLRDNKTKLYIIDFHYKGCIPCWLLHDTLNKFHEKYSWH